MSAPAQIGLFEGYGGLTRAVTNTLGAELIAYSEIEPAAQQLLAHHHPDVPNLGDITQIDWDSVPRDADRPLVLTGGFPCTDVSLAGGRAGLRPGTRSGLWHHMAYAIDQLRPELVVIENVRGLLSADAACDVEPCPWCLGDNEGRPLRALGAVLGDLANLGYDTSWCGLRAADVGAPHGRFRVFVTAWPAARDTDRGDRDWRAAPGLEGEEGPTARPAADTNQQGLEGRKRTAVPPGASRLGRAGTAAVGRTAVADRAPAPDAMRDGREGRQERDLGSEAGQPASLGGDAARRVLDWGDYTPAIRRWELILGRPAPAPTQTGKRGGQQLSPLFVEWMMGLPLGWVTDVPCLSRNEQLKMLGNGVVPAQAEAALQHMLVADAAEIAA